MLSDFVIRNSNARAKVSFPVLHKCSTPTADLRPGSYGSSTAQAIIFHPACSLAHNSRRAGDCSSP